MNQTRILAILIFDDVEVLDFCGPFEVFSVSNRFTDPPAFRVLTVAERDVRVGERETRVALGDEKFARRAAHCVEHAIVEHVPRADLLRDHLDARELGLHEQLLDCDATYSA